MFVRSEACRSYGSCARFRRVVVAPPRCAVLHGSSASVRAPRLALDLQLCLLADRSPGTWRCAASAACPTAGSCRSLALRLHLQHPPSWPPFAFSSSPAVGVAPCRGGCWLFSVAACQSSGPRRSSIRSWRELACASYVFVHTQCKIPDPFGTRKSNHCRPC
jgi:hypothetical protein